MGRRVGDCREGRDPGKGVGTGVSNWMSNREGVEAESNRDTGQSSDGYWSLLANGASLGWSVLPAVKILNWINIEN